MVKLQLLIGVDRTKKYESLEFKMGSNWASITHSFAEYLLNNEKLVKKLFKYGYCCDEIFIQTMFINSNGQFKNYMGVYTEIDNQQNMRSIDWKRGKPYSYSISDYDELKASGNLFCRKVDNVTEKQVLLLDQLDVIT